MYATATDTVTWILSHIMFSAILHYELGLYFFFFSWQSFVEMSSFTVFFLIDISIGKKKKNQGI